MILNPCAKSCWRMSRGVLKLPDNKRQGGYHGPNVIILKFRRRHNVFPENSLWRLRSRRVISFPDSEIFEAYLAKTRRVHRRMVRRFT